MMLRLKLPVPNIKYILSILDSLSTTNPIYEQNRQRHIAFTNNTINIAKCEYYSHRSIDLYTNKIYQPFFDETIKPVVIKLINTDISKPGFYLPHVDQKRLTSLNFYLELGGSNVTTSIYEEEGLFDKIGSVKTYKEVTLKSYESCNDKTWYLLDVNRYHSVENIENTRIVFTLSFENLSMIKFQEKYQHLIE